MRTSAPCRSKETSSIANFIKWIPRPPVFGIEVFERQRIGNPIGVESMSLISDDDEHSLAAFAAATNVNQLASVQTIAVEHRVAQGFPKREFNELHLSQNPAGSSDQAHQPVHQRGDQADLAPHPGVHIHRSIRGTKLGEDRLKRSETTNPNHFLQPPFSPYFDPQCPAPGPADLNLRVKKTSGAPIRHTQPNSKKQSRDARKEAC